MARGYTQLSTLNSQLSTLRPPRPTPNTLTLAQAHEKLKKKEISSEELTRACIGQIEAVDDRLNAVVYRNFESALSEAKKIDSAGVFDHPLSGIPYLTKDVYCEKGVPTTACSNILRNPEYKPPFNATTIDRLRAKGAISIGKANTDEFTMGASTETSCYGVTRNPWNTDCVAGGSSGGSAAGVAADECIFALGTDTGGSIRQPAAFCGIAGIRPTYGRTSRYGVISMASSLDTIGPLCKTVEDLAIVLQAIAGRDPRDATTGDREVPDYRAGLTKDLKGMKIGLPREYFDDGMNAEVKQSVLDGTATLKSLGAEIVDISLPHTRFATPCYYVLCPCEVSSNMARYDGIRYGHGAQSGGYLPAGRQASPRDKNDASRQLSDLVGYYHKVRTEGFGDEVKRRIMIGTYALSAGYYDAYYRQAQKVRALLIGDFTEAYTTVDAIVAPVTPGSAFAVGEKSADPVAMYLEDIFLSPQVMAGIPALSVPCGFTSDGMPLGMQIMGPQWGEQTVLNVAHAYEQATEWHDRMPTL